MSQNVQTSNGVASIEDVNAWSDRHRKRPDVNLRNAVNQLNLALKKAAIWEHRIPPKSLDRLREARNNLTLAADLIEQEWPDPVPGA